MYKFVIGTFVFLSSIGVVSAKEDEAVDASDPVVKAIATRAEESEEGASQESVDQENVSYIEKSNGEASLPQIVGGTPGLPRGMTLADFLGGLVPVENLEGKMADKGKKSGQSNGSYKGKYYTVYSRPGGGPGGGLGAMGGEAVGGESGDNDGENELSEEDPEDERDDDDSEETNL